MLALIGEWEAPLSSPLTLLGKFVMVPFSEITKLMEKVAFLNIKVGRHSPQVQVLARALCILFPYLHSRACVGTIFTYSLYHLTYFCLGNQTVKY